MSSMRMLGPRSDFEDARNLGSAKTGVSHWWMQRATAVALIPLTLWFTVGLVTVVRRGHDALVDWLESPPTAILTIMLLIVLFHHMALGLQVVIEDYVHSTHRRLLVVLAVKLVCATLAVAGAVSVLRIALGG